MATGVTVYCDKDDAQHHCDRKFETRMARAEYAREAARAEGWTRRQGYELCPPCSVREYGPHLKRFTRPKRQT
jgi:hypothetical protein